MNALEERLLSELSEDTPAICSVEIDWKDGKHKIRVVLSREKHREAEHALEAAWLMVFEANSDTMTKTAWTSALGIDAAGFEAQIYDWQEQTRRRLSELPREAVLDIGCGVGRMTESLLTSDGTYVGTDPSSLAIATARATHDVCSGSISFRTSSVTAAPSLAPAGCTLVVLNSVVQYFTSTLVVQSLLDECCKRLAASAHIFIGDVRDASLRHHFLRVASASSRSSHAASSDFELQISPSRLKNLLFASSSKIHAAKILVKRGVQSEFSSYRYDAIARIGNLEVIHPISIFWSSLVDPWEESLCAATACAVLICGIPNGRLGFLDDGPGRESTVEYEPHNAGVSPEDACRWFESRGFTVEPRVSESHGSLFFDLLITKETVGHWLEGDLRPRELHESVDGASDPVVDFILSEAGPKWEKRIRSCGIDRYFIEIAWNEQSVETSDKAKELACGVMTLADTLRSSWIDLLRIDDVDPDDDWFDMGGQSVLAAHLAGRVSRALDLVVPIRLVLENPRFEDMLAALRDLSSTAVSSKASGLSTHEGVPLSSMQRRILTFEEMHRGEGFYNEAIIIKWVGELNLLVLEEALRTVTNRHDALRSIFKRGSDGEVLQVPGHGGIELTELQELGQEVASEEPGLGSDFADFVLKPFDLDSGPLLRCRVLRKSDCSSIIQLAIHHAIFDGSSIPTIVNDLATLYASASDPGIENIPAREIGYARFSSEEAAWLRSADCGALKERWKHVLGQSPEPLSIPQDYSVARNARPTAEVQALRLEGGEVRELATRLRCTEFSVLYAIVATWAHCLSSSTDFLLFAPVDMRPVEYQSVVGCFINTVPLRANTFDSTFREFAKACFSTVSSALELARIPFEDIMANSDVSRFGNLVAYPTVGVEMSYDTSSGLHQFEAVHVTPKFPLTFTFASARDRTLRGSLIYDNSKFSAATASVFADQFAVILESVNRDVDQMVGDIRLGSSFQTGLCAPALRPGAVRDAKGVWQAFTWQAQARPNEPAFVDWNGETLTYRQIDIRVAQVRSVLASLGFKAGDTIAVDLLRNSVLAIVLLALHSSGIAYAAFDQQTPVARKAEQYRTAHCSAVIVGISELSDYAGEGLRVVTVSELFVEVAGTSAHRWRMEDPAYVIFTSGSTGSPKAVVVSSGALAAFADSAREHVPEEAIRFAQIASAAFDAFVFEFWVALSVGAQIVFTPHEAALDAKSFGTHLARRHIDVLLLTTSVFHAIAASHPESFGSLKALFVGGEVLDPKLARQCLKSATPPAKLTNVYGPSESTCFVITRDVTLDDCTRCSIPIGRPLRHVSLALEGDVPLGATAQLIIIGPSIASGYLGSQDNAGAFVTVGGLPAYKTGDYVRISPEGFVEFLGRIDGQIKVRGVRVEISEVESALREILGSSEAIVEFLPDEGELVAFITASDTSAEQLTASLLKRLPRNAVPTKFFVQEQLRRTISGKIDRRQLNTDGAVLWGARSTTTAAEVDEIFLPAYEVWMSSLGRVVGLDDNYFQHGGHSISLMRLIGEVEARYLVDLPFPQIYRDPTARTLFSVLETSLVNALQDIS